MVLPETIPSQTSNRLGSSSNISYTNGDICRICHCEADINNPLLSPCYCSGSLKYVHQSCLQQWLAASDTRSCELCKFNFILHTKIKPIGEWRRLEMSSVERRRLLCAILFHFVAAMCVVWSLFVLIDRAAEEVQKGLIAWPFWTKLVVVAVGFTGGAVFMYIQCRQYLHLFSRWKAHNRIILVQNAPEKVVPSPPSPSFTITVKPSTTQVIANIENPSSRNLQESNYFFEGRNDNTDETRPSSPPPPIHSTSSKKTEKLYIKTDLDRLKTNSPYFDPLEHTIQEVLALDIEHSAKRSKTAKDSLNSVGLGSPTLSEPIDRSKTVFKSLPNINFSKNNLTE